MCAFISIPTRLIVEFGTCVFLISNMCVFNFEPMPCFLLSSKFQKKKLCLADFYQSAHPKFITALFRCVLQKDFCICFIIRPLWLCFFMLRVPWGLLHWFWAYAQIKLIVSAPPLPPHYHHTHIYTAHIHTHTESTIVEAEVVRFSQICTFRSLL